MPKANGTNGTAVKAAKAATDYAKLLDDAELMRDGLQLRVDRSTRELNRLLGEHPRAAEIRQLFDRTAVNYGKLQLAERQVTRYTRLVADQTVTEVTAPPTTPPTDSERASAAHEAAAATAEPVNVEPATAEPASKRK
jgi:hypothetical protein